MKPFFFALLLGAAVNGGCGWNSAPAPIDAPPRFAPADEDKLASAPRATPDPRISAAPLPAPAGPDGVNFSEVVATINGQSITMGQLVGPLIESHGLSLLLNLVQLELARQDAARAHVVVTSQDIADERQITLDRLFKDDPTEKTLQEQLDRAVAGKSDKDAARIRAEIESERQELLNQFLENQHIARGEFELVLRINTYLRKIAEPQMRGKINDEALHRAFGQLYGERVHIHYIELANMQEVTDAKRRLAAGDKFEDVARDMSRNRASAALGGDLIPFSRQTQTLPDNFKDVAFSLKDGEVSDVVVVGTSFIIMKRDTVLPPKAVKFGSVKESIRATLSEKLLQTAVKKLREDLAAQALKDMRIEEPVLARQFEQKRNQQARDQQRMKDDLDKHQRLLNAQGASTTQPASPGQTGTPPATGAAPEAATAPAGERPPATGPGTAPAIELPRLAPDSQPTTQPAK